MTELPVRRASGLCRRLFSRLMRLSLSPPSQEPPRRASLRDFASAGCSLFPDGTFGERNKRCDCCFRHDIAYWQGGTEVERMKADEALLDCVFDRTKDKQQAEAMQVCVRAGGHPAFPAWYHWGYGWDYGRGYRPLTGGEL